MATATATAARVSAAVSYLRLLTALVTRAPNPPEAAARARVLIPALVGEVSAQAQVLQGENPDASCPSTSSTSKRAGAGAGGGAGVKIRSSASDGAILCMQTLRFLLGWSEQPSSSSSSVGVVSGKQAASSSPSFGSRHTADGGASCGGTQRREGASSSATLAFNRSALAAAVDPGTLIAQGPGAGAGRPFCHHGRAARVIYGGSGGGGDGLMSSQACFVCPAVDRCDFVEPLNQSVRGEFHFFLQHNISPLSVNKV